MNTHAQDSFTVDGAANENEQNDDDDADWDAPPLGRPMADRRLGRCSGLRRCVCG